MTGFIVKHEGLGVGKVFSSQGGQLTVLFLSPQDLKTIATGANGCAPLKRLLLPKNTLCDTAKGEPCRVVSVMPSDISGKPHLYQIEFESGLTNEASEVDLVPKEIPPINCPLEALSQQQLEGYGTFLKRETLAEASLLNVRGALGMRALLSSRIDLRPHQAYVAGTVLMDRVPRYLLADEVGLGKTIEAGIIIHDLLERKPEAKILILCPGTLTQQWLCELYAKFSGRVFCLLELRRSEAKAESIPDKTIASFADALIYKSALLHMKWDLVVVDEAHHLLLAPNLYRLAQQLSEGAPGCLLLSAVPAQHREEEYLRLLALLEPHRYKPDAPEAKTHFKQLYVRQIDLGRKLNYISRRLGEFAKGEEQADRILQKVNELIRLPVVVQDEFLVASAKSLDPSNPARFIEQVRSLVHFVGDRYRINRRILRNRRSQLIETEPQLRIARVLNRVGHDPDQLELDASSAVRGLVNSLAAVGVDDAFLLPLARNLFHSLCDPTCLSSFISAVVSSDSVEPEFMEFDGQIGYHDWDKYAANLWSAVQPHLDEAVIQDLYRATQNWLSNEDSPRVASLVEFLRRRHKKQSTQKLLIFAGFFGLGEHLTKQLANAFGTASVARFTWDMETKLKEKEVTRFKRDSNCWIMVSDETGGEGRNFQFVDELIHFDLPWHISKLEQRIGRLDRLGREIPEVCSNVFFTKGVEEEGLLECLESGFQIFSRSISGLEFVLDQLERRITQVAISEGYEGLTLLVNEIKEGAEGERAEDEVQGVLDAASLERTSAEVFRRAQSTPARDIALEHAFCDWIKFVGGNAAVRFINAGDFPEGIVEVRPNQLPPNFVQLKTGIGGILQDRLGTFRRKIAQERPDLEFFSVGNDFYDAICTSLHQSSKGRTYAVECQSTHAPWRGFEFSYRPSGNRDLLLQHPGLLKHLDRVLAVRAEHCFIGEDLKPAADTPGLLSIRKSLANDGHNETWRNFTLNNTRAQRLADYYATPGWEALVNSAEDLARSQAKDHFTLSLAGVFETERARIVEQIRQAKLASADGWEDETAGLEALLLAISGWDVELDTAGFLSVNGGIIP